MADEEMSPEEVAQMFGEAVPVEKAPEHPEEQIYAVSARIKNAATKAVNNNLTPVGVSLCNHYTHTILALYAFANTLLEGDKARMKELILRQELMPAEFVAGVQAVAPPQRTPHNTVVSTQVTPEELDQQHVDLDQESTATFGDNPAIKLLAEMYSRGDIGRVVHVPRLPPYVPPIPSPILHPEFWGGDVTPQPKRGLWTRFKEWILGRH